MGSDSGACPGCGSPLPSDARFCARCGRVRDDDAPVRVELTPVGSTRSAVSSHPTDHGRAEFVAQRRTEPGRASGRVAAAAAVVALGLLAVAIGSVVLDDSGRAATPSPSATPSSTAMTDTAITIDSGAVPSTGAGAPTNGSVGGTGPNAAPPPTSGAPAATRPIGPVLGPEQGAWSVYVSDGTVVRRVDLATGLVSERALALLVGDFQLVGVLKGRLVIDLGSRGVRSIAADLSGDVQSHPIRPAGVDASVMIAGDRLRSITYDVASGNWLALLTDLDGTATAAVTIEGGGYPVGFVGERALIVRRGRTYTVGASGIYEVYADGEAIAEHNGLVLWVGCDDSARCGYRVGDADHVDLGVTSLPDTHLLQVDAQQRGLAPDGQAAIVFTGEGGERALVKLTTGSETALPPGIDKVVWTPDGSWLVMNESETLYALNVRDGRIVSFDLGVTNSRNATIDVVIG